MQRYIAFLRAINVGGHTVKMQRLRELFEEMGFANVATFIASGNVIFDAPPGDTSALEERIGAGLKEALGYEVATFVRTPAQVAQIARSTPFGAGEGPPEGSTLYIGFLADAPPPEATERLAALANETDSFHVDGKEVYWLCHKTISQSQFSGSRLERTLAMPATLRNVTTVRRLAAQYA